MGRTADASAQHAAGIGVDDERDIDKPLQADIGKKSFGAGTRNGGFTSSSGHGALLSGVVVLCCFPRIIP